jgi:hypothetical protein
MGKNIEFNQEEKEVHLDKERRGRALFTPVLQPAEALRRLEPSLRPRQEAPAIFIKPCPDPANQTKYKIRSST